MAYDIIGDIHGQADKLEALLRTLGYRDTAGAWRHPERQAIFVGDFIDRGPAQVRSVRYRAPHGRCRCCPRRHGQSRTERHCVAPAQHDVSILRLRRNGGEDS